MLLMMPKQETTRHYLAMVAIVVDLAAATKEMQKTFFAKSPRVDPSMDAMYLLLLPTFALQPSLTLKDRVWLSTVAEAQALIQVEDPPVLAKNAARMYNVILPRLDSRNCG